MNRLDGREISKALTLFADLVIVGSGPAGAAAAWQATKRGASAMASGPHMPEQCPTPPSKPVVNISA